MMCFSLLLIANSCVDNISAGTRRQKRRWARDIATQLVHVGKKSQFCHGTTLLVSATKQCYMMPHIWSAHSFINILCQASPRLPYHRPSTASQQDFIISTFCQHDKPGTGSEAYP